MDGWMDRIMDERMKCMDGWMNERIYEWTDEWMYEWMYKWNDWMEG